jgi:hypothetical protein
MRNRSTRWPSSAGSRVTDAAMTTSTLKLVARATPLRYASPMENRPSIEITTVPWGGRHDRRALRPSASCC